MMPSDRAIAMIEGFEIGGGYIDRATWPGGASGVTVGVGYDLGYASEADIQAAWSDLVSVATLGQMLRCSGVQGNAARALIGGLSIVIPEDAARRVFQQRDVPRYCAMTAAAFACTGLSPDSFGALVSLVFNRGCGMVDSPPGSNTRLEMREIRDALAAGHPEAVPGFIVAMKRLWIGKGLGGLLDRRDAEAALFQSGLSAGRLAQAQATADDLNAAELSKISA